MVEKVPEFSAELISPPSSGDGNESREILPKIRELFPP